MPLPNFEAWLHFAELTGSQLKRGETLLCFLARHALKDKNAQQLLKLWFPHTKLADTAEVSGRYQDDQFTYCHIILPESVKLGNAWQHYMWHTREPHILLFRRPTVQQSQKCASDMAGSVPAAIAAAATARVAQAAAAPMRSAPTTAVAPASVPQTAPAAVAKAVPAIATAVEHQSESLRRRRVGSKKGTGNGLGDGLTPPCQQVVTPPRQTVPGAWGWWHHGQANQQDETVAAAGLSPHLFAWQIPDLEASIEVIEAMIEWGCQLKLHASDLVKAVSRIVCLCRGVRGIHGIRRVGAWAKTRESMQLFCMGQLDGAEWFRVAGRMLQKYFENETLMKGEKNHTWLGHCEGRHYLSSGMHFLLALQVEPAGAALVATHMGNVLLQAHLGGGLTRRFDGGMTPNFGWVMPEESVERLLTVADGEFPVSLRSSTKQPKSIHITNRMSECSAMDVGRFVIGWLCSCRNVQVPLTPRIFDMIRQSSLRQAKLHTKDTNGILDFNDFMKKVDVLRYSARHVMKPPRLDPELRWRDPTPNWVTVFSHICEVGGLCQQWRSSDRIEAVCQRASVADVGVICNLLQTITETTCVRHSSVTIGLAMAMESVGDHSEEQGSSTNDENDNGGDDNSEVNDGSRSKKKPRHCKVPWMCDKCGATVRRDVIMRHQQTAKCKAVVRQKKKMVLQNKKQATEKLGETLMTETKVAARKSKRR